MTDLVTRLRAFSQDADAAAKQVGYGVPDLVLIAFQENAKLFKEAADALVEHERRFAEHLEAWKKNNAWHAARISELERVLRMSKTKLELYRAAHSGEYLGGQEYSHLIKLIDAALDAK